ncbi:MAG: ferritin-like domain-containing protein [Planctomycetota bacterium]
MRRSFPLAFPLARSLARRRDRAAWADPRRRLLTLESFAATEEDGGQDLVAAARRVTDPDLRAHVERHAADELRHARMFRDRAREVAAELALSEDAGERPDRPYDLSRGRPGLEQDAHGFFSGGLYDELGEVEYVAMLHVAESRAADLFAHHLDLVRGDDPATAEVFEAILRDEKYHMAYTARFLERWEGEGRAGEVARALRSARSSRAMANWRALGLRSGAGFGKAMLWVAYWVLVTPFALVGRLQQPASGWQAPAERDAGLESQA